MERAGATRGAALAQAASTVDAAPRFEAYDHADVASLLSAADDERAALHVALGTARQTALEMPLPLDVVPRHHADAALEAAEAELAALRAELARTNAQLRRAGAAPAAPASAPPEPVVPPTPPPMQAATPVAYAPQEPFSRTTGLLQVVTWSMVVAVVLIALLAWFG